MKKQYKILIADDSEIFRKFLMKYIQSIDERFVLIEATNGFKAFQIIQNEQVDIAFLDNIMPEVSGIDILKNISTVSLKTKIVIISGYGNISMAVESVKYGAFEFIEKPILDLMVINNVITKIIENNKDEIPDNVIKNYRKTTFIGQSLKIKKIKELIENISYSNSTVLITGESGTGKDIIANLIHEYSPRKNKKFVTVNCSAIPETLIESELFGYKKGSFTGAVSDNKGLFEEANGGTLFLDEIGDMPLFTQAKVLRAIQNKEIKPIGSNQTVYVDVRIITATNKNLQKEIAAGRFRPDLWYRLNVFSLEIPPLRERKEDIAFLSYYFLEYFNLILNKNIKNISKEVLDIFNHYKWSGNVRELENTIERMCVLENSSTLTTDHIPEKILIKNDEFTLPKNNYISYTFRDAKQMVINQFEKDYVMSVLKESGNNISKAAKTAGMDRANFKKILNKYQFFDI